MTVPVKDSPDRFVGWVRQLSHLNYTWWDRPPPACAQGDFTYGAFRLRDIGGYIENYRWVLLERMHPWDLSCEMHYQPEGYRKMVEGNL